MEDWVRDLINDATKPIRRLVDSIVKKIQSLWRVLTSFFKRVHDKWLLLRSRFQKWLRAQVDFASSVAVMLRWLIRTQIPKLFQSWASDIRKWTASFIERIAQTIRQSLSTLERWARQAVADVRGLLSKFVNYVNVKLNALESVAKRLLAHVFGPLATPERLAAWAGAAILGWVIDYLADNAVTIGRRLWRSRRQVALEFADDTIDILARIL